MKIDVFCDKAIREGIFFETKHTMALYDIAPAVKGHSLIVPKRHVNSFIELTPIEITDFLKTLKVVIPVLLRLYGDESNSYNLLSQIGEFSGMSIPHLHIHLLPRRKDDLYNNAKTEIYSSIDAKKRLTHLEYIAEVARIKLAIKS